jgi:hypothetical protein
VSAAVLERLAREAGSAGVGWSDWLYSLSDELSEAAARLSEKDRLTSVKAAFHEGRRACRVARGWRSLWTTAPEDYDTFGTETVETCGDWHGKTLRRVLVDPVHADYQAGRYGSGMHGAWEEDPRVEEARIRERIERDRAEREERDHRRAAGLEWLASAEESALAGDEDVLDEELRSRALTWTDLRAEQRRRGEARAAAERAATWARCRAALPDGATLIDPGSPGRQGHFGWIPGREPRVWHAITVKPSWRCPDDAVMAEVIGEGGDIAGTLDSVADCLAKGELRLARPGEHVPPRAAIARIGCTFTEIVRAEVEGRVAWVGRPRFGFDLLAVDERGHLLRSARVRRAAESAYLARQFGSAP